MTSGKWNIVAFVVINYLLCLTEFQLHKEKAASQNKIGACLTFKTSGNFHHYHYYIIVVVCWPGRPSESFLLLTCGNALPSTAQTTDKVAFGDKQHKSRRKRKRNSFISFGSTDGNSKENACITRTNTKEKSLPRNTEETTNYHTCHKRKREKGRENLQRRHL